MINYEDMYDLLVLVFPVQCLLLDGEVVRAPACERSSQP